MPRRGSNIYKRKDGRFEGRVPIGHKEDGSLKYKFVYARTLSEVKEKMAQFQAVLQNQPVSALKLTVAEASRQWLSAAKLRVKPSSYAHYENIIRNHILPDLGTKYLTDMTTHQLNDFVFEKLQSGRLCGTGGLSARFVQDIMRVYHSIEQYAVQEYHIRGTHFTMPKAEKKQLDVLSSEERKKLEQYLLQTGLTIDLAILLCLFTGLRVGELCGLQWSDIDFENGTLSVKRTVQRIYRNGCSDDRSGHVPQTDRLFSCKCCCLFSAFEIPPDKFSDCSKQENACFFSDSYDLFMNFQKYILYFF